MAHNKGMFEFEFSSFRYYLQMKQFNTNLLTYHAV